MSLRLECQLRESRTASSRLSLGVQSSSRLALVLLLKAPAGSPGRGDLDGLEAGAGDPLEDGDEFADGGAVAAAEDDDRGDRLLGRARAVQMLHGDSTGSALWCSTGPPQALRYNWLCQRCGWRATKPAGLACGDASPLAASSMRASLMSRRSHRIVTRLAMSPGLSSSPGLSALS